MRKDDARKLDHKTLEEMRSRAVKRIQDGERPAIIAGVLGVDRSTVYGWQLHAPHSQPDHFLDLRSCALSVFDARPRPMRGT